MRNLLGLGAAAALLAGDINPAPRWRPATIARTRLQKKYRVAANARRAFALASKRRNRRGR